MGGTYSAGGMRLFWLAESKNTAIFGWQNQNKTFSVRKFQINIDFLIGKF